MQTTRVVGNGSNNSSSDIGGKRSCKCNGSGNGNDKRSNNAPPYLLTIPRYKRSNGNGNMERGNNNGNGNGNDKRSNHGVCALH